MVNGPNSKDLSLDSQSPAEHLNRLLRFGTQRLRPADAADYAICRHTQISLDQSNAHPGEVPRTVETLKFSVEPTEPTGRFSLEQNVSIGRGCIEDASELLMGFDKLRSAHQQLSLLN